MSNKINAKDIAAQVAKKLISNPDLLEQFKGNPYGSVEEISGVDAISVGDMGTILDVLLAGSDKGGGLLGEVAGTLVKGKTTKLGSPNIAGELVKQVVGQKDSSDILVTLITAFLTSAITNKLSENENAAPKKSSTLAAKKSSSTAAKKTTTTKKTESSSSKKSTTAKPKSSSTASKKKTESSVLADIVDTLDKNGVDISELITSLLVGNKK